MNSASLIQDRRRVEMYDRIDGAFERTTHVESNSANWFGLADLPLPGESLLVLGDITRRAELRH